MLKQYVTNSTKENVSNQIDENAKDIKQKDGYEGFHEIFVKRHRKILMRSAKNTTLVLCIILVAALIGIGINPKFKVELNQVPLKALPFFLLVMYVINRGQVVTQAMFMNCDQSMLSYNFYRQPKAILELFQRRLFTLIKINLIPAFVIAIGLPLILYMSGGTENEVNYMILFISILSMSVFFSVHHMVLYYLCQPYNSEAETKSSTFAILNNITYFVAFIGFKVKLPTIWFGTSVILFTILYVILSLILAYKFAPKTFKLR